MVYQYAYPRPAVTVDAVVFSTGEPTPRVLLIQRKHDPYAGHWALPGGFIEMDESLSAAVRRELKEETGLEGVALSQLGAYGDVERDPRGRTISIVYWGRIPSPPTDLVADSDAAALGWFALDSLPSLAFDHAKIIADAREATAL
jgi:8-oxo-dGTP diphosphatase